MVADGRGWTWADTRATEMWSRGVDRQNLKEVQGFMFQPGTTSMSNEFKFEAAKSLRISIIVLASFNAVAGAATAFGIFWDRYLAAKRSNPGFKLKPLSFLKVVGPAETFPFILSCGIVVQSILFAVAQSVGLETLLVLGCTPTSQSMLPALFMVPYIQLVFGLETTVRALGRHPFPERRRWTVPICLSIVVGGVIGTAILTRFIVPPNFCFAELMWLVERWRLGCFGLLTAIACALLIGAVIIFARLYRSSGVGETQRASASWMACYMVLAVMTLIIMLPFFWSLHAENSGMVQPYQMQLSTAAAVAANLSGLTTGGLYVLLRSNRLARIGGRDYLEFDRQKPKTGARSLTLSHSTYTKQMERPVSPVRLEQMVKSGMDWVDEAKDEEALVSTLQKSLVPRRSNVAMPILPSLSSSAGIPSLAVMPPAPTRKPSLRKDAYNIFPPRQETSGAKSASVFPAATTGTMTNQDAAASQLSIDVLLPPPAVWTARRQRNSSMGSSATVQIGLRVSNINDMPPVTSSVYGGSERGESVYPDTFGVAITTDARLSNAYGAAGDGESLYEDVFVDEDDADKQLPPVPLALAKKGDNPAEAKAADGEIKLSPTVYSPQKEASTKAAGKAKVGSPSQATPPDPSQGSKGRRRVGSSIWI